MRSISGRDEEGVARTISVAELARLVGGRVAGGGTLVLRGVAGLETAGPEELSFFTDSRRRADLEATRAGALVAAPGAADGFPGPRIEHPNPYLAFARAAAFFHPPARVTEHRIHPAAVVDAAAVLAAPVEVDPLAVIAAGVRVGAGSHIGAGTILGRGAVVGRECRLHPRVVLYPGTVLGDRVEVHSGAVLGADGFGNARDGARHVKFPQVGRLVVEDDVEIGANTTIDRAALGETRICRGVKLDNLIMVAHGCRIGEDTAMAAQAGLSGSTTLGARCLVGGQAAFAGHLTVGDDVVILARTGVHKDLPAGTQWLGTPAQPARLAARNLQLGTRLHELLQRLREVEREVAVLKGRGEGPAAG